MLELLILGAMVAALLAAGVYDRRDSRRHVEHLLAAQDGERYYWQRERSELLNRIQAPEMVRMSPPAPAPPPAAPGRGPAEPFPTFAEDAEDAEGRDLDDDESHLIGQIVDRLSRVEV